MGSVRSGRGIVGGLGARVGEEGAEVAIEAGQKLVHLVDIVHSDRGRYFARLTHI